MLYEIDHVWQVWITQQTTPWPQTTPQIYSVVTLDIGAKRLNNDPHQWCSGPRTIAQIWIRYPTISCVLYESWSTSARGGSSHRPPNDHKLHPRHAQLLPWILEPRSWIIILISHVVVQGLWCRYGYGIPPFHVCYMSHEPYLAGVHQVLDSHITTNYTLDIFSCYPGYWNKELEP